ncbi:hypothetical protein M011DRAFT_247351 [Sporormia fimetaria CBS 119925]|uniref:Uncharacterized protein n=1 Tax=Sporormia fimetaria CBS 119925 TaxID=1340428 RepID=A0A6A6UZE7_9PLEO|nr:hypothetical protein M011DRAFT_247351 [Sporormia fimetaria CBS 119925]
MRRGRPPAPRRLPCTLLPMPQDCPWTRHPPSAGVSRGPGGDLCAKSREPIERYYYLPSPPSQSACCFCFCFCCFLLASGVFRANVGCTRRFVAFHHLTGSPPVPITSLGVGWSPDPQLRRAPAAVPAVLYAGRIIRIQSRPPRSTRPTLPRLTTRIGAQVPQRTAPASPPPTRRTVLQLQKRLPGATLDELCIYWPYHLLHHFLLCLLGDVKIQ